MLDLNPIAKEQDNRWWLKDPITLRKGFGIVFHKDAEGWIAGRILEGSPAQKAGIKKADRLASVDSYSLKTEGTLHELGLLLTIDPSPSEYRLSLIRADGSKTDLHATTGI